MVCFHHQVTEQLDPQESHQATALVPAESSLCSALQYRSTYSGTLRPLLIFPSPRSLFSLPVNTTLTGLAALCQHSRIREGSGSGPARAPRTGLQRLTLRCPA